MEEWFISSLCVCSLGPFLLINVSACRGRSRVPIKPPKSFTYVSCHFFSWEDLFKLFLISCKSFQLDVDASFPHLFETTSWRKQMTTSQAKIQSVCPMNAWMSPSVQQGVLSSSTRGHRHNLEAAVVDIDDNSVCLPSLLHPICHNYSPSGAT